MIRNLKTLLLCITMLINAYPLAYAQDNVTMEAIDAVEQPGAIALYPGSDSSNENSEQWNRAFGQFGDVHIDIRTVRNVTNPTITPVLPKPESATGAAVIVAPGGAFLSLSIDSEGYKVADWLADHGIAAFVLKYRLNETPRDIPSFQALVAQVFSGTADGSISREVKEPRATVDALRALEVVRSRAAEFSVDPTRVGMIGFSAGAMTALNAVLEGAPEERPAFFGYIYGPMSPIEVPADAPPMFAAIAMDDGLFSKQGFGIVESWRSVGRPVELHAYERGEHGFGIGVKGTTSVGVMPQFLLWLEARGVVAAHGKD